MIEEFSGHSTATLRVQHERVPDTTKIARLREHTNKARTLTPLTGTPTFAIPRTQTNIFRFLAVTWKSIGV